MKPLIQTTLVCLGILCISISISAQQSFKFNHETAQSITAATYLTAYQSSAFYNRTFGFYYDNAGTEEVQADWFDLDPVDISAALRWDDNNLLLFNGANYILFSIEEATLGEEWNLWPGFPDNWSDQLDAATRWSDNLLFFFQGNEYLIYDIKEEAYTQLGLLTDWEGWPDSWTEGVDAVQNLNDGKINFFSGGQVLYYDLGNASFSKPQNIGTPTVSKTSIPATKTSMAQNASRNRVPINNRKSDNSSPANNGSTTSTSTEVKDEYLDNYADHTAELANDASDWTAQPLPGLDWLGAGFDILRFDPMEPNNLQNRKRFRSVIMTNSPDRAGNRGQYLKPYGTFFGSESAGRVADSSAWVTSYKSFQNSFNISAGGSVSVPKVASSSLSGSYSEMNSSSVGSENIYMINKNIRRLHRADIRLTWREIDSGQKYRQKLDPVFRDDVAKLPLPRQAFAQLKETHINAKGQRFPKELFSVKTQYETFLRKYGTHFASSVTWGGQYISRTQIRRLDYERSRMTKMDFQNSAEVTIKKVTVGRSVEFGMGSGTSNGSSTTNFRREVFVQGGNGEDDLDKWRDKVDLNPAPVHLTFTAMCDLLIEELFPNDPDIETKKEIMRIVTENYIHNNYREPKESKGDFFRELPPIPTPGNISVKNGGGYVMWFTVKYQQGGKWHTKETSNYTLGFTKDIEVPADATNITVIAEHTFGKIFTKKYTKPTTVCFTCWGTVFNAKH
ncbi:MAG: MAC/perforin domain-containing protein, partial [Bacteroidota bacterium]